MRRFQWYDFPEEIRIINPDQGQINFVGHSRYCNFVFYGIAETPDLYEGLISNRMGIGQNQVAVDNSDGTAH